MLENLTFLRTTNVPNFLTIFRMISSPVIAFLIYLDSYLPSFIACLLFAFAGLTDFLDGYLARKLNARSKFGECFDPIADKLMVVLSIVALGFREKVYGFDLIPVMIIISREIMISGMRGFFSYEQSSLKVCFIGKFKTSIQIFSITLIVFSSYIFSPFLILGKVCLWFSAFLSLLSLSIYLKKSILLLKR